MQIIKRDANGKDNLKAIYPLSYLIFSLYHPLPFLLSLKACCCVLGFRKCKIDDPIKHLFLAKVN